MDLVLAYIAVGMVLFLAYKKEEPETTTIAWWIFFFVATCVLWPLLLYMLIIDVLKQKR